MFFTVALALFFIGVIAFAFKSLGLLPSNMATNWGVQLGAFAALILFAIAQRFDIPVYFVGVGEGVEDLQPFDPDRFVEALLDSTPDTEAAAG